MLVILISVRNMSDLDPKTCQNLTNVQSLFKLFSKPQPVAHRIDRITTETKKFLMKGLLHGRQSSIGEDPTIIIDFWIASSQMNVKDSEKISKNEKKEKRISNKGEYELVTIYRNNLMNGLKTNSLVTNFLNLQISKSHSTDQHLKSKKNKDKLTSTHIRDVTHVVCATRGCTFKIDIDGQIWDSVKYFTVSPESSSNIKYFPFGLPLTYD
ncbi:hypothetical protein RF11_02150 [Thelohanellus kitauei]|uniref:Phosphofurin acidic cluster sorting protein 1/2 C-terminal domain-containing protein n=1 Tax=Thelohanellus kitauei TaxID=669202 RepID=A0A0C2JXT6_THEKT|nr:hypothetical protein RF11_02150 [Thelohanellus kitauei]